MQHNARKREAEEEAKRLGVKSSSVDQYVIKAGKDFEFDDKQQMKKFMKQVSKRHKTLPKKNGAAATSKAATI